MSVTVDPRREIAIKRIKDRYDFKVHLFVYVVVNAMLVALWALTGGIVSVSEGLKWTFFWPIFPIVFWGIGVVINWYVVYHANVYTEEDIQREMKKIG